MKLLTIILLTVSLNSAGIWKDLKPITSYKATDYTLNSKISYIELRRYHRHLSSNGKTDIPFDSNSYTKMIKIGQLPKLSSNKIRMFNTIQGDFGNTTNIRKDGMCLMSGCGFNIVNAFMIDKNSKMWRLNEIKDVINFIKPIDTPAEIRAVIWLHYVDFDKSKIKYKNIKDGYEIFLEYENNILNRGECGKFGYKFKIYTNGKITKKIVIYKTKSKDCIAID